MMFCSINRDDKKQSAEILSLMTVSHLVHQRYRHYNLLVPVVVNVLELFVVVATPI